MKVKGISILFLATTVLCGCGGPAEDVSPAKPMDPQTQIKNIENSNMTPEQKKAAMAYAQQGAAQAELQKKSAGK